MAATDSGAGVSSIAYRIHNSTYDSGWTTYVSTFNLNTLTVDSYSIDYNSTDNAGNVELTRIQAIVLDNSPPSITPGVPMPDDALQDGVALTVVSSDASGVQSVIFSVRNANGSIISNEFEDMPASVGADGKWRLLFNTVRLPDGFYSLVVNGTDVLGNSGATTVQLASATGLC